MNYGEALKQAISNSRSRDYPGSSDSRSRCGTVFPKHKPKFVMRFSPEKTIFTIGSCFARNIEEALFDRSVFLPTVTFKAPPQEWPHRPNGLLNEYNPGAISQRIIYALERKSFPPETIVANGDRFADLLLTGGSDVTMERATERRAQIDAVYSHLARSDLAIITLGFVEAWFDQETQLFLNRAPPHRFAEKHANRFVFKRLDVFDCMPLLEKAVNALAEGGIKVILTVSPVPLNTTFTAVDCVVANEFSKSVLRVCAERLSQHRLVDYFPSYEIVRCSGMAGYIDDQIHVRDELVRQITSYMVSVYYEMDPANRTQATA